MNRDLLQRVKALAGEISSWSALAQAITDHRQRTAQAADAVVNALRSETLSVTIRERLHWRALPLRPEDGRRIATVPHHASLPPITPVEFEWLGQLTGQVSRALIDAKPLSGLRRMFSGAEAKQTAEAAGHYLLQFQDWAVAVGIPAFLARIDDRARRTVEVPTNAVLNPQIGLVPRIADLGAPRLGARIRVPGDQRKPAGTPGARCCGSNTATGPRLMRERMVVARLSGLVEVVTTAPGASRIALMTMWAPLPDLGGPITRIESSTDVHTFVPRATPTR